MSKPTIAGTTGQDTVLAATPRRRRWALLGLLPLGLAVLVALAWPALSRWSGAERSVSMERLRLATVRRRR